MYASRCLTTGCLLVLATALVAQLALCDKVSTNQVSVSTAAPKIDAQANGAGVQQRPVSVTATSATVAPVAKTDVKTPVVATVAPSLAPAQHPTPPAATQKPLTTSNPTSKATSATMVPGPSVAAAAAAAAPTVSGSLPGQKLAQYFEPICNSLEKLSQEHMFTIQSQMKQFIERTQGKMSVCFMQHYMIDPNLTPVNKQQLTSVCSSRTLIGDTKGSFKSFQTCAENNWDKNLNEELDRIIRLRLNCFTNHSHSKNDSTISLVHQNDDVSLITEVVGKVLDGGANSGVNNKNRSTGKSNITVIDVGPAPKSSAPAAISANKTTPPAPLAANDQAKKIMNDPNTLLVLVDDSAPTTLAPAHASGPAAATAAAASHLQTTGTQTKAPSATITSPGPVIVAAVTTLKPTPSGNTATPVPVQVSVTHMPEAKTVATNVNPAATSLGDKIINAATTGAPLVSTKAPAFVAATQPPIPAASAAPTTVAPAKSAITSGPTSIVSRAPSSAPVEAKKTTVVVASSTMKPITLPAASSVATPVETDKKSLVVSTTGAPAAPAKDPKSALTANVTMTTTKKPALVAIIVTTSKPAVTTAKPAAPTAKPVASTAKPADTTTKPKTTPAVVVAVAATSVAPTKQSSTGKPVVVTTEGPSKRQEKEKQKPELKKDQDEKDAKDAIKALQMQRAGGHVSDARMHQIEHERQMTIDPVGHTLKHQKYEQMKQQRTSTKAPSASSSSKKP